MPLKTRLGSVLRRLRLMPLAEEVRYAWLLTRTTRARRLFEAEHPAVRLPPTRDLYETFGLDYRSYYYGGREVAQWIAGFVGAHLDRAGGTLVDWGCGPARVVRHLPAILGPSWQVHGTDLDEGVIAWCRANVPDVEFHANALQPPLPFAAGTVDALYSISVLTHLSRDGHGQWVAELCRLLNPGGLVVLTTHGEASAARLSAGDRQAFDRGEPVTVGRVREGSRLFASYQPAAYVSDLLTNGGFEVVEHEPGDLRGGRAQQDVWVARRRQGS